MFCSSFSNSACKPYLSSITERNFQNLIINRTFSKFVFISIDEIVPLYFPTILTINTVFGRTHSLRDKNLKVGEWAFFQDLLRILSFPKFDSIETLQNPTPFPFMPF